ncbi:YceI family protein [Panacagrimonas perspica]|uniref:YceI family protein n=1 Tax=Panacagrimonas perspica TaxID=381431 RepID=UPI0013C30D36|nr:YceI family protein [Panacagrimonas perspica]
MFASLVVASCQTPAPQPVESAVIALPDLRQPYLDAADSSGEIYTLDPADSTIRLYVFRGGKAAKAGHNHVLGVSNFEGYVRLDPSQPRDSRFDLRVPVDALQIDDPAWREQTGGNFSPARSEADIAGTRRNMLGPKVLDAVQFPHVELHSRAIAGDWPVLVVEVAVTIKGATHVQPVMVRAARDAQGLRISGEFVLRQTDFGMEPFSVLGGLMAVQDEIGVTFELRGRPGLAR